MPRSDNVTLAEAVNDVLERQADSIAVSLPGTVVSYDNTTRTVTVRPGVHRLVQSLDEDDDDIEHLPALQNVPVCWPQGRGFSIIPEDGLVPGDPVLLVCCDRDFSQWWETGQPSAPDDARTHSWGSAVAIPGMFHAAYTNAPEDAAALASKVLDELTALRDHVNSLRLAFNFHAHGSFGTPPIPATTPPADPVHVIPFVTPTPTPSSMASTVLKLDE